MNIKWNAKDIIDLEFFLHNGENADEAPLESGKELIDRKIFLEEIQPHLNTEALSPSTCRRMFLRLWLEKRREMEVAASGANTLLPGDAFNDFYRLFFYLFAATGIVFGWGLAFTVLAYTGKAPINISIYLGAFVLTQIALVCGFILLFLFRGHVYLLKNMGPVYQMIGSLFVKTITRVKSRAFEKIPAGKRYSISAALGLISGTRKIYSPVFYWVPFLLIQVLGIGFNLGVLAATFARVLSSDLAFGWQSTIQFNTSTVYHLVKSVAVPWSWLVPQGIAYPSLEQIEGSKMVLKDGIYHLATMDLVAWWPFLCFCVLCYGLLPRLILAWAGWIGQAISLRRIKFSHAACERLIRRLQTPVVQTGGDPYVGRGGEAVKEKSSSEEIQRSTVTAPLPDEGAVILVQDDIFDRISEYSLSQRIKNTLGFRFLERIRIGLDPDKDVCTIRAWADTLEENFPVHVVLLQEAWQPPIKEGLSFLKDVRKILGKERRLYILLMGRPAQDGKEMPPSPQENEIWRQAVKKLADPYVQVETVR
jgi:hypothetical protein